MATNEAAELQEFGTTDEPTEAGDGLEPRAECWCADERLACWDHWQTERDVRGEF